GIHRSRPRKGRGPGVRLAAPPARTARLRRLRARRHPAPRRTGSLRRRWAARARLRPCGKFLEVSWKGVTPLREMGLMAMRWLALVVLLPVLVLAAECGGGDP